jgi:hypothetical protein
MAVAAPNCAAAAALNPTQAILAHGAFKYKNDMAAPIGGIEIIFEV